MQALWQDRQTGCRSLRRISGRACAEAGRRLDQRGGLSHRRRHIPGGISCCRLDKLFQRARSHSHQQIRDQLRRPGDPGHQRLHRQSAGRLTPETEILGFES